MKIKTLAASALLMALAPMPAFAAKPPPAPLVLGSTPCSLTDVSPTATGCTGWYEGNLNSGNGDDKTNSATALNTLLGTSLTGTTLTWLENIDSLSGNSVDFSTALYGETVVAFHVGGANGEPTGVGYNATAFFKFDAGNLLGGLDTFSFNRAGLSNARLYSTGSYIPNNGVPEPATWGLLIVGFGLTGGAMRRRKVASARHMLA